MAKTKIFQTLDLYLSAFLLLRGVSPGLQINSGKVIFLFDADDAFYELLADFNSNALIPVTDFCTKVKVLRGQMLSLKGGMSK